MADRVRVHRPIIYGSHARLLTEEERATAPPAHTHKWTVFVTSATSPPPKEGEMDNIDYLPGGADDLSYMIKRITFKLHDTYTPASRVFEKAPYQVTETGWGEFVVNITIRFIPEASEKPLTLLHNLKLHHWGPPIQGSIPAAIDSAAPTPTVPTSAAPTPGAGPEEKVSELSASTSAPTEAKEEEDSKEAPVETVKTETEVSTPAPSDSILAVQEVPAVAPGPVSIATKLPVHSWQYDELVFSDPPATFLDIMNEHPPTPLPAKFRRPKDQREKEEGPKKKKGRASTIGINSRAQTAEPGTASGTPAPAGPVVGIAGEAGSADVPLEFAKEMETGEYNRLEDARQTIIEQTDQWRTRLIAREKELAKLKEEMKIS